jgi:hypothetical protein
MTDGQHFGVDRTRVTLHLFVCSSSSIGGTFCMQEIINKSYFLEVNLPPGKVESQSGVIAVHPLSL